MTKSTFLLGAAAGAFALHGAGQAQETTAYSYDALGRLVQTTVTGGPVSGQSTGVGYDAAGNRCTYTVTSGGGAAPASCTSGPPTPPSNNPPTPVADTGSQQRCTTASYTVTANDTDPDGDYPLTVTAVSGGQGFSVLSGTTIQFVSAAGTGNKTTTYTVQDSRGATATATLTVNVSGGICE